MRRLPPPLSVTKPPPSSTSFGLRFLTLAVAAIVIVTGSVPQLNVTMPPLATALTTAADEQPAGVPVPMTRVGCDVSTAFAAAGTVAWPFGLPAFSFTTGLLDALGPADGDPLALGAAEPSIHVGEAAGGPASCLPDEQAVRPRTAAARVARILRVGVGRTPRCYVAISPSASLPHAPCRTDRSIRGRGSSDRILIGRYVVVVDKPSRSPPRISRKIHLAGHPPRRPAAGQREGAGSAARPSAVGICVASTSSGLATARLGEIMLATAPTIPMRMASVKTTF